jgi:hypothetical protein
MTELELYKFICKHGIEHIKSWKDDKTEDILIFVPFYLLEEFIHMIRSMVQNDEPLEIYLKETCVCIWMEEICEWYGIDKESVFNP